MVFSYCGRLAAMRTNCDPMMVATAPNDAANMITTASAAHVWLRPKRRRPRTKGAISRLRMNASVIGTSTSRAK